MKATLLQPKVVTRLALAVWIALALFSTLNPQSSSCLAQGSLTPPGPPTNTFKTLDQIEPRTPVSSLPFTISNAGAYYVTTNLTSISNGIAITADDVTLDLGGFTLSGGFGFVGINVSGAHKNLAIQNGTLRGWGTGIEAVVAGNSQFERLRVFSTTGNGGVRAGTNCQVLNCTAELNRTSGLEVRDGSIVMGCTARSNTVNGGFGIITGPNCVVTSCTAFGNDTGISAPAGSAVISCVARSHTGGGIAVTRGIVKDSVSSGNGGAGIFLSGQCLAQNNVCDGNGVGASTGNGIDAFNGDNRIEGNVVTGNDVGINSSGGNIILKNSASGNGTNYIFGATDVFGPTNNLVGAGGVITNANPWANFTY